MEKSCDFKPVRENGSDLRKHNTVDMELVNQVYIQPLVSCIGERQSAQALYQLALKHRQRKVGQ